MSTSRERALLLALRRSTTMKPKKSPAKKQLPTELSNLSELRFCKDNHCYQLELSSDLEKMFMNNKLTDAVIIANDQEFHVHKMILAARSPVFLAMFETNMREKENNLIEIVDIDSQVIIEMIYFMYTGKVKNLDKVAKDLFIAAEKYDIKSLKNMCTRSLGNSISLGNVTELLLLSDCYNLALLKSRIHDFIACNWKDFQELEEFKALDKTHPQLVIDTYRIVMPKVCELSHTVVLV